MVNGTLVCCPPRFLPDQSFYGGTSSLVNMTLDLLVLNRSVSLIPSRKNRLYVHVSGSVLSCMKLYKR